LAIRKNKVARISRFLEKDIFVDQFYPRHGRSPSCTEIAAHTTLNRSDVHNYLVAMNDEGMIEYNGQTMPDQTASPEYASQGSKPDPGNPRAEHCPVVQPSAGRFLRFGKITALIFHFRSCIFPLMRTII